MRVALLVLGALLGVWIAVWFLAGRYTCDSSCPGSYWILWIAWVVLAVALGIGSIAMVGMLVDRFVLSRRSGSDKTEDCAK